MSRNALQRLHAGSTPAAAGESGILRPTGDGILDVLPIGILVFRLGAGKAPICVWANRTFEEWAGQQGNSLIGLTPESIPLLRTSERLGEALVRTLQAKRLSRQRLAWSSDDGERARHLSAELRLLDEPGGSRLVVAVRDRSPEIEAEANLRRTMLSDPLTGLPNRLQFTELLEQALDNRTDAEVGVLIVNVDRFKRINESLGHVAGDEFLVAAARRLVRCVRGEDHIARLAADEFAILLSRIEDEEDTRKIIGRVREHIAEPMAISGGEIFASASIGIATTKSSAAYAEDMLRDANFALHQAKSGGTGSVAFYTARDHSKARELFRLEADLRRAIEAGELKQVYQPLVDLATGRMNGFEALARWTCPERGIVSPADFIPVAEDSGLIVPLGRWALRCACAQLAAWRAAFPHAAAMHVAVNVSGVQLARDDLIDAVREALHDSGLPGHALKIELTESAIVENPERARRTFEELKTLDCVVAMDDFGTGYSSLSYLQRLPIDILKIDQSFVAEMLENEDSQQIVEAILSLANALGMTTVAEGIETEAQMRALTEAGCTIGQGYYFDRPLSPEDMEARLARRARAAA